MDSICRIKGIKKEEYPELYETIESVCEKFNLKTIRVTVWPWGFNAAAIFVMDWLLVTKEDFDLPLILLHSINSFLPNFAILEVFQNPLKIF